MSITDGFDHVAFLLFIAGTVLALEKYSGWRIFRWFPALVVIYALNMTFATVGIYDEETRDFTVTALRTDIALALIFVSIRGAMHVFREASGVLRRLLPKLFVIFIASSVTIFVGTVIGYMVCGGSLGDYRAVAALYASWVGGSNTMAAMNVALAPDQEVYRAAVTIDAMYYSLWIGLLLWARGFTKKWNAAVKAEHQMFCELEEARHAHSASGDEATGADTAFVCGLSLLASAIAQHIGGALHTELVYRGIYFLDAGTCGQITVVAIGALAAMTPIARAPNTSSLSTVYLCLIISLLASGTDIRAVVSAPGWLLFGLIVLAVHACLMFVLARAFRWDLCAVSSASMANIGGSSTSSIVASTYDHGFAAAGVIMGVFGSSVGNVAGLLMNAALR